jgi:hypothetical protein
MKQSCLSSLILAALTLCCSPRAATLADVQPASTQTAGGVVQLPPFVVEAASAPARLRIDFRHHMVWARLKSLTFTDVPAAWAKSGIKAADHVVKIDGKPLDGMRLIKDFAPFLNSKLDPLMKKKVSEVPFLFDLQSDDSKDIRQIKVTLKSSTCLTIYSYGY